MNFITLLDYVGTFAFAISGIRLASAKHFDWFGAYVVGFVTAVGGGTLRDLLLGLPPFWMQNVSYLVVSGFAFLFVVGLRRTEPSRSSMRPPTSGSTPIRAMSPRTCSRSP